MPYQKHPGNKRMHKIVEKHKRRYNNAKRHEKAVIVGEVIELIRNVSTNENGDNNHEARFLQKSTDSQQHWIEQTTQRVFNKVGHALRGNKPGSINADKLSRRRRFRDKNGNRIDQRRVSATEGEDEDDATIIDTYPLPLSEPERLQRKQLLT